MVVGHPTIYDVFVFVKDCMTLEATARVFATWEGMEAAVAADPSLEFDRAKGVIHQCAWVDEMTDWHKPPVGTELVVSIAAKGMTYGPAVHTKGKPFVFLAWHDFRHLPCVKLEA